jgi:hypothetical protein
MIVFGLQTLPYFPSFWNIEDFDAMTSVQREQR